MYHTSLNASILLSLLLSACASGTLLAPDDGTETETATPTDVGTESPCGAGAPDGCEERVGESCWFGDIPEPDRLVGGHFTDGTVSSLMASSPTCGFLAATSCPEANTFIVTQVPGDGVIVDGELVLLEGTRFQLSAVDLVTREQVSFGLAYPAAPPTSCTRTWYGDRASFPCMDRAYEMAVAAMPSCMENVECDYCACRVNEVTDATSPDCVSQ